MAIAWIDNRRRSHSFEVTAFLLAARAILPLAALLGAGALLNL